MKIQKYWVECINIFVGCQDRLTNKVIRIARGDTDLTSLKTGDCAGKDQGNCSRLIDVQPLTLGLIVTLGKAASRVSNAARPQLYKDKVRLGATSTVNQYAAGGICNIILASILEY